ncbi:coil containing protein [Vibrio phage 1.175.O._10N.261.55.B3]|nr:coil containing protein [Vibrio phage 1.175.O._10N.261.55.B3]
MDDQEAKELIKSKRLELKSLQDEYSEMTNGVENISFDDFFESIGTDWGNLMFSGLNWFECDGFVYLASGMDLSSNATEILGSEFEAAQLKSKGQS